MKYCSKCGASCADDARFCHYCGNSLAVNAVSTVVDVEPVDLEVGYRVVLFSIGTCKKSTAKEVLADLIGYTPSTVADLIKEAPVEIADELSYQQALIIAQAMAEYGMEVTIVDENNNYINVENNASLSSVFNSDGSIEAAALAVLATLTAVNRVHRYRKYKKSSLLSLLFKPLYQKKPPVHVRRTVSRDPEPARRISVHHNQAPRNNRLKNHVNDGFRSPNGNHAINRNGNNGRRSR